VANTDITQRAQYERSDLLARGEGIRHGSERGAAIYNAIALVIGAMLSAVAVATIENWSQWLVLGVIVITTIGFMIAVSPNRRG
jgi:1,4-dihydroxy-2-naphthoate octaprenyltransferase